MQSYKRHLEPNAELDDLISTMPTNSPTSKDQVGTLVESRINQVDYHTANVGAVDTHTTTLRTRDTKTSHCEDQELGRGRSGVVFKSLDEQGRYTARKVFGASGLTKIVQYAFLGAPNPYMWCEPAAKCAFLRRRILSELVHFWFGGKLRVAHAYDYGWNESYRAFEMRCELITGRHVALQHGQHHSNSEELCEITKQIMEPLQGRLIESGFDGLVWQAGKGNPVALNNFMCIKSRDESVRQWAWIDLESGVPALIPMNPLSLLSFYLPKCFHHKRPLFDDVDLDKLKSYVKHQTHALGEHLGESTLRQLNTDIDRLASAQEKWKSLSRLEGSINYQVARGSINRSQAKWFKEHPLSWYKRELGRAVKSMPSRVTNGVTKLVNKMANINIARVLKTSWNALRSQTYRELLTREYVSTRIDAWNDRGQLPDERAAHLRTRLDTEETNAYLTDFGAQLATKPFVKLLQFWIMPLLWMAGLISPAVLAMFIVGGGSIVRTLYTVIRIVQNTLANREKPWIALFVGIVPVVGNLAFPAQIVAGSSREHSLLARFLLHDTCSRLGRCLPIWGGQDTRTEHVMNRVPNLFLGA